MLFQSILDYKYRELLPSFEALYQQILNIQTHESDLLLVHLNGFYHPEVYEWDNVKEKLSPYMFGPNHEGHSAHTHHGFIGEYIRKNLSDVDYEAYKASVVHDPERVKEIEELNFKEAISIQTEMLIYLKIWESDTFIKQYYQLANLLAGQPYDWHYKLMKTSRDKGATGSRDEIIRRKIRNQFKGVVPRLYDAFRDSYNFQIRNSIAHSQYSILGRYISLNNHVKEDPYSQLHSQSFEQWVDRFHETLVIYTLLHNFLTRVNNNYGAVALENDLAIPIRITRKDPIEEQEYKMIYYREFFKDWGWQREG